MLVWDLPITNWESVTAAGDEVGNALIAARRQFVRAWNEAHLRVLTASLNHTKQRVVEAENANPSRKELVGFDQSSWDEWLKVLRELVEKTFRDVFEITLNSKSELHLSPPEFALECSIFFTKSSLVECEGHPFGDFFAVFFAGHSEDGSGRNFISLREEFKRSITAQVLDLYDESVITLARRGWNPRAPESGAKVEESSAAVSKPPTPELLNLDEIRTLRRRDLRSHAMIRSVHRPLAADIVHARALKLSPNLLREDRMKLSLVLCKEKPELYPVLSQATVDEIDTYIFGSERHINESEAAVEIIKARCGGVLKLGTIKRYTRPLHKKQTPHH